MEGNTVYQMIEGKEAVLLDKNPCYQAPPKFELESVYMSREAMFLDENPCYQAPSGFEFQSVPVSENSLQNNCETPSNFESNYVATSKNPLPTQSKYKKAAFGRSILLVGIILVGSVAIVSMGISLWTISRVSLSISKITEFQATKNNISEQIVALQASTSMQIMQKNYLSDQIMELKNTSGYISNLKENIKRLQDSVDVTKEELSNVSRSFDAKLKEIINSKQYDSCSHASLVNPPSPSGHYWIRSSNGSAVRVYCDFNRQCGCDGPSTWTRVAFLNMSDPNQVCPKDWTIRSSPVRTCSRGQTSSTGCNSVFYSTFGMTFSRVCGRIIGYQWSTTDAFQGLFNERSIDRQYVDGVSLTHGSVGSRQHIWSFASALGQTSGLQAVSVCDCSNNNNWVYNLSFVGNDYFCDSGNRASEFSHSIFYTDNPLWDGKGCLHSSTCCQFNNPPWFCKTLPQSITDDLEVRICHDGNDEDTPVQLVELYVQ